MIMSASLRVIAAAQPVKVATGTAGSLTERVQQLQAEAKRLAGEHVDALRASLLQTQRIAEEIAQGGEAYPAGVRDIARRLAEDSVGRALNIEGIMARL
jgi:hypothetical protein